MVDDRARNEAIFRLLLFFMLLLILVLAAAVWMQLSSPAALDPVSTQEAMPATKHLINDGGLKGHAQKSLALPVWMTVLIGSFVLMQIFSLLLAASIASRHVVSARERARVELLCETPMYLGLLGSLVGVCVTQFLAGTLAAPLAYITTISGIVFYLFGRYTIALSLAGTSRFDD